MFLLAILALLIVFGAVSMLPLRLSLIFTGLLLAGGLSFYVAYPVVKFGVFPVAMFVSALAILTLFAIIIYTNRRAAETEVSDDRDEE